MKRFLSILLAAVTLISFVSCAKAADPDTSSPDTSAVEAAATVAETEEPVISDDLPDTDMDGWTFRIFNTEYYQRYAHVEEMTGEVVNDAVYNANINVMERFNCSIDSIIVDDTITTQNSVKAASDDFEVSMMHDCTAGTQALQDLFMNVRDFPYVNFDKPWWPEFTVESLTVGERMYLISNHFTYLGMDSTRIIFFNMDKLTDYGIDAPYDDVRDGTWTLDKLDKMTRDVYEDIDGNGKQEYTDFYGFALTGPYYCWLEAFNIEAYAKDPDTVLRLDINSERMSNLCDKIYSWLYEGTGTWYTSSDSGNYKPDNYLGMFSAKNAMFTYGFLERLILACRETDINYGILPMPKLDDSQQSYYSGCTDRPIVVPKTNSNIDYTAMMIEAMSAEGYKTVLPAYYETALKWKYANDNESAEMLDIIFTNRRISLSYIHGSTFPLCLATVVTDKGADWASYYAKQEKAQTALMEKTVAFYTKDIEE